MASYIIMLVSITTWNGSLFLEFILFHDTLALFEFKDIEPLLL